MKKKPVSQISSFITRAKNLPLDRWYLNAGNTRNMKCNFMDRKRQSMWGHAVVYGWAFPISSPRFSKSWGQGFLTKIKPFEDAEATVIGFEEAMKNNNPETTNALGRNYV